MFASHWSGLLSVFCKLLRVLNIQRLSHIMNGLNQHFGNHTSVCLHWMQFGKAVPYYA